MPAVLALAGMFCFSILIIQSIYMSYTIALFEQNIPENFQEALEFFEKSDKSQQEVVSPIFQEFYDEIAVIFPCICTIDDDDGEEGVWCDGPLINNFKCKVPVIGFTFSKVAEALPVVIETANDMGISVLDWQSGMVFNS